MDFARAHYDDGTVACDETGLAIRRYYPWGARRILYGEIRDLRLLPLGNRTAVMPWQIWGPVDLEHWWNLDPHRAGRRVAVVLDTGERFKPTVTPADPTGFETVLRAHLHGLQQLRESAAIARLTAGANPEIPAQRSDPPQSNVPDPPVAEPPRSSDRSRRGKHAALPQRSVEAIVPEPTTRVPS